jgi:hypothetical protein
MAQSEASAMQDLVATLKEVLPSLALTPDKIKEALKPYVDPALEAREKRSRAQNRQQFIELMKAKLERQNACAHKDKNQRWAICLQHNFPDRAPRGICPLCELYIQPRHWDFKAPDEKHPEGEPFIVPEHPLYHVVKELESMS